MNDIKSIGRHYLLYNIILIYLELVLRLQMNGSLTKGFLFFLCFVPAQALLPTLLSGFFEGRKNGIVSALLIFLLDIYYIAQLIYFNNFGSLFSASMMGMGAEAVENFGWTLEGAIRKSLPGIFLFLLPVFAVGGLCFFRILKLEKIRHRFRPVLLLLIVPVWILGLQVTRLDGSELWSAYTIYHDTLSDTDNTAAHLGALTTTVVELISPYLGTPASDETILASVDLDILTNPEFPPLLETSAPPEGTAPQESALPEETETQSPAPQRTQSPEPLSTEAPPEETETPVPEKTEAPVERKPQILEEIDLTKLAAQEKGKVLKDLSQYLENRGATETNEYTGLFEGYNLIYICAESFWTYALNEQVTPTLCMMAQNGIVLNNYYNSFLNTTTNGEYAFATSLWPDFSRNAQSGTDVGSFPQSAHCYMPMGLGDLFEGIGVPSYAYHNYFGVYYRRCLSWPNLGYTCKFAGDGMRFSSEWPASDLELMQQSVDDYLDKDRFHAYYMTFSGHGPYSRYNAIGRKNFNFVKEALGEGYSDSAYSYLAGNRELDLAMEYLLARLEEAGKLENTVIVIAGDHYPYNLPIDSANELAGHELDEDFEIYKSPCIIYNAGLEEPIVTNTYCCNVDILPTILNLFAIPFDSRLMMGRDIFSDGIHKAVIYNKSFLTDMVCYNSKTGDAVWAGRSGGLSPEMKKNYLSAMNALIKAEYYSSSKILELNYFQYVWYRSGLMTAAEVAEEQQRAEQVISVNEEYNIAEQEAKEAEEALKAAQENEAQQQQEDGQPQE